MESCLCDCIPGPYRTRLSREAEDARRASGVGLVRGDSRTVGESKAVRKARSMLDGGKEAKGSEERRVRVVEPPRKA